MQASDSQPASVFLDTPFFIDIFDSNIEPWNSTAKLVVNWDQDVDLDFALFNFDFVWRNESFHDVLISAASVLIARGLLRSFASSLFGQCYADVLCFAKLNILELWNDPPTSPLFEYSQSVLMGDSGPAETSSEGWPSQDAAIGEFFQGFQLYHNNFFTVPARQAVVFQVGADVGPLISSLWDAGGNVMADFATDGRFLLCPFVELQVLTIPQQVGVSASTSSRRTTSKKLGRTRAGS